MKRKLLEDPLLAIRKREEMTKREITNNPIKRKQLQQIVRDYLTYLFMMFCNLNIQ